jgi:hypothetical protein
VSELDRRQFLRRGAMASLGVALGPAVAEATARAEAPEVRAYRTLGRTGLRVPDIAFGSSRLDANEEFLVRHAFERGVTYFDTAESYTDGGAETAIGRALRGRRDRCVIASKVESDATARRDDFMRALEGSLRRLGTDWIDVYFNHAVNDVARLKNPEWHRFVDDAKRQGKIRWVGMSGHGSRLVECLTHALDTDQVDAVLVAYNFGQDGSLAQRLLRPSIAEQTGLPAVLKTAHAKGVGVLTMKTLMGARLNDMRPWETGGATFAQAAFRWVLSNPDVDAVVITMTSREHIDEYLGASGARARRAGDRLLLERYLARHGDTWCRPACGACESACPSGVPVGEVLRARMYARDYEDVAFGRREYAALGGGAAAACVGCTAHACTAACPHGVLADVMAADAHALLA